MRTLIIAIGMFLFPMLSFSQDVPSQKKIEGSENTSIMMYLRVASVKYDSLIQLQQLAQYVEQKSHQLRVEIAFVFGDAEKEMLKVLGRNGYNPDVYTIMIKTNDQREIELHVVRKSDLPQKNSYIGIDPRITK